MIMVGSSRVIENSEYKINQEQRMDQDNDLFDILQLLFQRLYVYIRDFPEIIQKEFLSFFQKAEIQEPELNDYSFSLSKYSIADLLAFYTICAVLGILIVVTTRNNRIPESCIDYTPSPTPEINVPLVDLTEDDTPDRDSLYELPRLAHPWGDSIAEPERLIPQRIYFYQPKTRPYCCSIESRPSHISVRSTSSHQFQTTRAKDQLYQRQSNNINDWLIRRTRSGQIYGKYPIQTS
ncbi:hypothetical protein HCN44_005872 [Aphidius gifuensis]|uniref:Uncharacterized protein n=1 Tax=Aphidius gifuensis TaxID=684658 RepID=A0A834XYD6_APHGI|nr:uncharacterized protein LOC122852936 [Aphidius gifuensis]XP_044009008.1 uncharacterized protein LOC122852936 [Aphidius gifuensis]KAF7993091.1 hypothetical protein HCN44_005872 [Aphidius gifuensis]